jgi:hypothetical protein
MEHPSPTAPTPAVFCSLNPLGAFGNQATTLFIATATPDSLPGGKPRRMQASVLRGGTITLPGPPYSQVVQVERLTVHAGPHLQRAIRKARGRVLLIPWGHGPDCSPGSWTGRTLWMKPGTRGLFGARLRPADQWLNEVPTFDVSTPYYLPYPSGPVHARDIGEGNALSADELMSFYDSIPRLPAGEVEHRAYLMRQQVQAVAILKWAAKHPEMRSRPPLKEIIRMAEGDARRTPYMLRESPLAGTWRFTATVASGDTVVGYGRTQPLPTGLMEHRDGSIPPVLAERIFGYYLYTLMGRTEADLDIEPPSFHPRSGFVSASFEPEIQTGDSTVWSAGVEILAAAPFSESVAFRSGRLRANAQYSPDPSRPRYAPGRIVRRRDGTLELTVVYGTDGQALVEIKGKRISKKTWAQN